MPKTAKVLFIRQENLRTSVRQPSTNWSFFRARDHAKRPRPSRPNSILTPHCLTVENSAKPCTAGHDCSSAIMFVLRHLQRAVPVPLQINACVSVRAGSWYRYTGSILHCNGAVCSHLLHGVITTSCGPGASGWALERPFL